MSEIDKEFIRQKVGQAEKYLEELKNFLKLSDSVGGVPRVHWSGDGLLVSWDGPSFSGADLRARAVVS